jgi:Flp pilus assembly protein CpaB
MSGRRLIAIIVGVVGILLLAVVAFFLIRQNNEPDPVPPAPEEVVVDGEGGVQEEDLAPTPTIDPNITYVNVVVSLQTVPRGWQMTEAELAFDERASSQVGPDVLTSFEEAIGLFARQEIYQGETLTKDSLVRDPTLIGVETFGPSSLVPPGWVAMAVPMDRLNSVAFGYAPGDSVDIMLSFTLNPLDQEFQTLLSNSASFFLQQEGPTGVSQGNIFVIDPYGRFETIATGDLAHIAPSEDPPRPVPVSVLLQQARIVHVGTYNPPLPVLPPTPTPDPNEPTPTPGGPPPTPPPPPPEVVLVALNPQQQLFLKYAIETTADIDFALRGEDDAQIYTIEQLDISYLLGQFGIDVPPNAIFSIGGLTDTSAEPELLEITP